MMVSDAYRESEVCLNEMGAAWMVDDLIKKIVLLPNIGFDRIGWLMSLSKGTRITDEEGLDAIHDQIMELFSLRVQTSTWNREKQRFLKELKKEEYQATQVLPLSKVETEPMDLLDFANLYEHHVTEYRNVLGLLTQATIQYNNRLRDETKRLQRVNNNHQAYTNTQLRGIMIAIAKETDNLSAIYEANAPLQKEHFAKTFECALALHNSNKMSVLEKREAIMSIQELISSMIETKDALSEMSESLDTIPDLDKTLRKSKKRLKNAIDGIIEAVMFSIRVANGFIVVQ